MFHACCLQLLLLVDYAFPNVPVITHEEFFNFQFLRGICPSTSSDVNAVKPFSVQILFVHRVVNKNPPVDVIITRPTNYHSLGLRRRIYSRKKRPKHMFRYLLTLFEALFVLMICSLSQLINLSSNRCSTTITPFCVRSNIFEINKFVPTTHLT